MNIFDIEKLIKKNDNKYKISVIAARRARSMTEKVDLDVKSVYKKATSIALEEALTGKIKYEEPKKKSK